MRGARGRDPDMERIVLRGLRVERDEPREVATDRQLGAADPQVGGKGVPLGVVAPEPVQLVGPVPVLRPARDLALGRVGLVAVAAAGFELFWETYRYLQELPEWRGLASFLIALLLLAIAVAVSAVKAGLARKLAFLLPNGSAK